MTRRPRALLAVTADTSLQLMAGLPDMLASRGWDVDVVSSPGPRLAATGAAPHVRAVPLPMRREPSPVHDALGLVAWVRVLRRVRPDVVDVGTPKAGLLGTLAAALCRVPVRIYTLRGLRYESAAGWKRRLLVMLERVACRAATDVVAVSASLRDRAVADGLVDPAKVTVLGAGSSNGVDLARFAAPSDRDALAGGLGLRTDLPVVGFVGRIHADKGVDLLLDAAAELRGRGTDFTLLIVGGADDESGRALESSPAAQHPGTILTGEVGDVAGFLGLVDVLCLPTKREGFPNVVLEAAAAGVPTVATLATGVPDAVVDGFTGTIVERRDPVALADALERYLANADARAAAGRAARVRATDQFARAHVQGLRETYYRARLRTDRAGRSRRPAGAAGDEPLSRDQVEGETT